MGSDYYSPDDQTLARADERGRALRERMDAVTELLEATGQPVLDWPWKQIEGYEGTVTAPAGEVASIVWCRRGCKVAQIEIVKDGRLVVREYARRAEVHWLSERYVAGCKHGAIVVTGEKARDAVGAFTWEERYGSGRPVPLRLPPGVSTRD